MSVLVVFPVVVINSFVLLMVIQLTDVFVLLGVSFDYEHLEDVGWVWTKKRDTDNHTHIGSK
jgi:hypothetical protein